MNKSVSKQLGTVKKLSDIPKSVTAFNDGCETLCYKSSHFFLKKQFQSFPQTVPLFLCQTSKMISLDTNTTFVLMQQNIDEPKFPSPKSKIVVNLQQTLKECERWCILQVRRLRIQHKIKSTEKGIGDVAEDDEMPEYTSSIPLLPPMVCLTATLIGLAIPQ